jgi:hypothetical protein
MGNELSTKTYPSGKVVSSFKLSKTGSKADSLAGSTVVVRSLCGSTASSTAPTTPDHTTDSYKSKYESFTLQQTSTNQPPRNRIQGNMTDETPSQTASQTVNQSLPSAETYDKNESEERRNAAIVLQVCSLDIGPVGCLWKSICWKPFCASRPCNFDVFLHDLGRFTMRSARRSVWNSLRISFCE